MVTGTFQFAACALFLFLHFPAFMKSQQAGVSEQTHMKAMEQDGETALMGLGVVILVAYFLQPLSILVEYFAIEGFVRAAAAFIHNEPVGTLPLYLLMLGQQKARKEYNEHQLGPRVPDAVEVVGTDEAAVELKITSCRPKDWNQTLTIRYQENMYELAQSLEEAPPRRFVYLLRRAPRSKVVRGLLEYDPESVLLEKPD